MSYKNKTKIFLVKFIEYMIYVLWDLAGIRFIYRKLNPYKNYIENDKNFRKPSTLILWIISIYIAMYGLAKQELRVL